MDHTITVAPGSEFPVQAEGDFVFCKFADRDIRVIIQNSPRTMRAGSKWRPAGGFEAGDLIVQNPDPVNPVAVVLTIGTGDFDDQIIHGEVTVNPGIRGRNGVFIDDTRSTVRLSAAFGNIMPREYTTAGLIVERSVSWADQVTALDDGRVLTSQDHENWKIFRNWPDSEPESIISLGTGSGVQVGPLLYIPDAENVPGLGYRLVINTYDAATLELRERLVTEAPWVNKNSGNPIVTCLAFVADRFFISNGQDRVDVIGMDGAQIEVIEPLATDFARGLIVRGGLLHILGSGSTDPNAIDVVDPVTLQRLDVTRSQLPDINVYLYGAALTVRDTLLIGTHNSVREYALEDVTISASGTVSACAGSGRFKAGQVDTIAQLYTQRLENGRVLASGQLLRAVLEIYAGRYMPNDYLDYIYAVKADNLNGISPRVIDAGGQSFAAAGIADDAAGTFPQTIEITLREGLL